MLLRVAVVVLLVEVMLQEEVWATMLGSVEGMGLPSFVWSFTTCSKYQIHTALSNILAKQLSQGCFPLKSITFIKFFFFYLLVFGSADVGCVCIGASAGHVTQLTAKLVLSTASQNSCAAAATAAAAAAALGDLQRRLLLLVLLPFQMLLVRLKEKSLT